MVQCAGSARIDEGEGCVLRGGGGGEEDREGGIGRAHGCVLRGTGQRRAPVGVGCDQGAVPWALAPASTASTASRCTTLVAVTPAL